MFRNVGSYVDPTKGKYAAVPHQNVPSTHHDGEYFCDHEECQFKREPVECKNAEFY